MRWIPFAALALATCAGPDSRPAPPSAQSARPSSGPPPGPDAVVLRAPRAGGRVRAYAYARLDSAIWTSTDAAPPLARVLAFDESAGSLAVVDTAGIPRRLSLRLGTVGAASRVRLAALASADGYGIYGVQGTAVTRLTPSDARAWSARLGSAPREVLPQPDGSVLVVATRGAETLVVRLRPPDAAPTDTAVLAAGGRAIAAPSGDRVYFAADSALVGVHVRTLEVVPAIDLGGGVRDAVVTPSGDRLYVLADSATTVGVVDRYRGEVATTVTLPAPASALRMDPLGRYLLARAAAGDSAYVIAIGTDRLLGAVSTAWRADLPFVAPDGLVAAARGADVVLVDGETLRDRRTVRGGARDFWHLLVWNGFRGNPETGAGRAPREAAAAPVDAADTALVPAAGGAAVDGRAVVAPTDSARGAAVAPPAPPRADSAPARSAPPAPAARGFTAQLAAVRSEAAAREVAAAVRAEAGTPRIVATQTSGTILYRVVLGPFPTEAEAERAGRRSGRDYWVYEGEP